MVDLNALTAANAKRCLTQARLKEWLHYDPETGLFSWLRVSSNRVKVGRIAGSPSSTGHVSICLFGERFLAHRLAWLYMTGEWPKAQVDHKDRCRSNNRWGNLREATNTQNAQNSAVKASSRTGLKGVAFTRTAGLFTARIRNGGKRISLGCYLTAEEAHQAYTEKAKELHGEFARAA
jgi:hypothetical protein